MNSENLNNEVKIDDPIVVVDEDNGEEDSEPEVLSIEDSLIAAEEAIGFLEDDFDDLVGCAAAIKATLLLSDRDDLGPQGCVTLDAKLGVLSDIFGDDL